ncbi:hypothetical protein GJ496_001050 [Pomphorhynchus laevis]|nr:hypothetical protein GJ496_001050 [Pomphorhynchus laevis]
MFKFKLAQDINNENPEELLELTKHELLQYCAENGKPIREVFSRCEIKWIPPNEPDNFTIDNSDMITNLRANVENYRYQEMIKDLTDVMYRGYNANYRLTALVDIRYLSGQLLVLVNFCITLIGSFYGTLKAIQLFFNQTSITFAVIVALCVTGVVFAAEIYFLIRQFHHIDHYLNSKKYDARSNKKRN